MRIIKVITVAATMVLVAGCSRTVRPLSDASYREATQSIYRGPRPAVTDPAFAYHGELSEFDVLGLTRDSNASEADIQRALDGVKKLSLKPGASILLIQSGAIFPDGEMVKRLAEHFRVVPFSGVPPVSRRTKDGPSERFDAESFSRSLRLAAARGGCDTVLCYWGILESENARLATKTVSWLPMVNWILPDENQHMRIRLKLALVDVRTGDWAVLSPPAITDSKLSVAPRRGVADQKLVEGLKRKAYETVTMELVERCSEVAAK